jgi:hypothetical protein
MRFDLEEYDSFRWKNNIDYVMGIDGELKNTDGSPVINYDYRYNDNDSIRLEKTIEEKKNELKRLEEKKKEQIKTNQSSIPVRDSAKKESIDDKDNDDLGIKGSPIWPGWSPAAASPRSGSTRSPSTRTPTTPTPTTAAW